MKNNTFIMADLLYTIVMSFGVILITALIGLWALSLFFGYITGLSKNSSNAPSVIDFAALKAKEQQTVDDAKSAQQQMIDDAKFKQQQMMADIKQKIQDQSKQY